MMMIENNYENDFFSNCKLCKKTDRLCDRSIRIENIQLANESWLNDFI